jgi:hypothetical protein
MRPFNSTEPPLQATHIGAWPSEYRSTLPKHLKGKQKRKNKWKYRDLKTIKRKQKKAFGRLFPKTKKHCFWHQDNFFQNHFHFGRKIENYLAFQQFFFYTICGFPTYLVISKLIWTTISTTQQGYKQNDIQYQQDIKSTTIKQHSGWQTSKFK